MLEETRVKVSCDKHMTRFQLVQPYQNDNTVGEGESTDRRGWSEQVLVGLAGGHARVLRAPVRQPRLGSSRFVMTKPTARSRVWLGGGGETKLFYGCFG